MTISTTVNGAVLEVTIDRPKVMNSLDAEANAELRKVWLRLNEDSSLYAAILTGAGDRSFSAGADLRTLIPAFSQSARTKQPLDWEFGGGLARGLVLKKPVIAAVNGHCLAGGLEMALACDIRICSPNATFGLAEVKWAIIPGAGGTQRLPRAVPLGMAMEMILTGDPIDANEALRIGLVNRVLPLEQLLPSARELAQRIAARAPFAVQAAKKSVFFGLARGFDLGMELENDLLREAGATDDAIEGTRAFMEKRQPKYCGR